MAILPSFLRSKQETYSYRPNSYLDRPLQLQFIHRIITMVLVSTTVAILPAIYFINQNFNYIRDLLADVAPELIRYVEREQVYANGALLGLFLFQICFLMMFSKKMSSQLIAPITKLSNHLKALSRGEFTQAPVRTREFDEYQDLIINYNYFYKSLRAQSEKQIASYQEILKEKLPPGARGIIQEMLLEKTAQLGRPENVTVTVFSSSTSEESSTADDSRHVS